MPPPDVPEPEPDPDPDPLGVLVVAAGVELPTLLRVSLATSSFPDPRPPPVVVAGGAAGVRPVAGAGWSDPEWVPSSVLVRVAVADDPPVVEPVDVADPDRGRLSSVPELAAPAEPP